MPPSEYDPLFSPPPAAGEADEESDLARARELFRAASAPYLRSPWSWLTWALLLPAAALLTSRALAAAGAAGALYCWSAAIAVGGAVEIAQISRGRQAGGGPGARATPLAGWVLRLQGNLSLVALALSALLLWEDLAWALPGLWLLLLGHSFYVLGGIAFPPFRLYGLLYQLGGLAALWPRGAPLPVFAATAAAGNLWMAYAVWRETAAAPADNAGLRREP